MEMVVKLANFFCRDMWAVTDTIPIKAGQLHKLCQDLKTKRADLRLIFQRIRRGWLIAELLISELSGLDLASKRNGSMRELPG